MDFKGSYTFAAPPAAVWTLLMDPVAIASCVPGCEGLEPIGPDSYRATLTAGVGAITGTYEGVVSLVDKDEPHSYRLLVDGKGRPGFVKGDARVVLSAEHDATRVDVTGTVQVGGLIASVGQRLLGSVSKMMLDRFFACMAGKVGTASTIG